MRIGVIGCGMVSHAYCGTIARSPDVTLAALASRSRTSAEAQAARYGGTATEIDALLADPAIDIVVVLAPPDAHHPLGRRVLEAGKHLYLEKPLATSLDDAADLLALAAARGLAIGCAPDTFLGEGHGHTRRLVEAGAIGRITGAAAAFGTMGMEAWHPDPAFFFAPGGGPLLDIGPYYLTRLVDLIGPVEEVTAIGTAPRATRTASGGSAIEVAVPTSVAGAIRFAGGAIATLSLSWDVAAHTRPPIELYGERGTIVAPDPNGFGGETRVSADGTAWRSEGEPAPAMRPSADLLARGVAALMRGIDPVTGAAAGPETPLRLGDRRGLGVIDLAAAVRDGRPPRASGALAYHVLETLLALERSVASGERIAVRSTPF